MYSKTQKLLAILCFSLTSKLALADVQHPERQYLKPGASVRVASPEHVAVGVGETAELSFRFSSQSKGFAELKIVADEALSHSLPDSIELDLTDGPIELPLELSSAVAGRHYIHFSLSMYGMSRNISYGQTFGDEKAVAALQKTSNPAVGGIKRSKAQESIYQE